MNIPKVGCLVRSKFGLVFAPGVMVEDGKLQKLQERTNIDERDPFGFGGF
jgi:hypothetical protein